MVWHLLPRLNGFLVRPRQYVLAIDHFLTCPPVCGPLLRFHRFEDHPYHGDQSGVEALHDFCYDQHPWWLRICFVNP